MQLHLMCIYTHTQAYISDFMREATEVHSNEVNSSKAKYFMSARLFIISLRNNLDFKIKDSDKQRAVIIMHHSALVQENERRLSTTTVCRALSLGTAEVYQKELYSLGKKCLLDWQEQ